MNVSPTLGLFLWDPIVKDGWLSIFAWWQIFAMILLVVLIVFWVQYRKRQM